MIVCLCSGARTRDVLESNHLTLKEFKRATGSCQQCCKCHDTLKDLWTKRNKNP